jgi:small redox-active disulfide protein 2
MKIIEVLGSGCAKCVKTAENIQSAAEHSQIDVQATKETNPETIMSYGVMSTPAVVIDGQLVHSGSIPDKAKIAIWLNKTTP